MGVVDFQKLPLVEQPQDYLENTLKKAAKRVAQLSFKGTRIEKARKKETERIIMVRDTLLKYLEKLVTAYPSIDELPEFYRKLIASSLDYTKLKKALGSLRFAQETIKRLSRDGIQMVRRQEELDAPKRQFGRYLGRVASVLKQIGKNLTYLEKARQTLLKFPALDPEVFTVAIAGFPNVGKSTLLSKITTATPQIKNYAFTTKGLNVGTFEYRFHTIQCVDTPGTLGRVKENDIEALATIARRYVAKLVVYVFDITESYPLADQKKLLKKIEREGHDIILYLSKTDVLPKEQVAAFKKEWPDVLTTPEQVKKHICAAFKEWE